MQNKFRRKCCAIAVFTVVAYQVYLGWKVHMTGSKILFENDSGAKSDWIFANLFMSKKHLIGHDFLQHKSNQYVFKRNKKWKRWKCPSIKPKIAYLKEPKILGSTFTHNPCNTSQTVKWNMVFFVKSATGNFIRRELLRRTWGSLSYVGGGRFYTLFVTGKAESETQSLIDNEYDRYFDILQIDQPDGYKHIAQKTLAGMQWASENLPDSYYYSSVDDDIMVNLGRVQDYIDRHKRRVVLEKWPEFPIICMLKLNKNWEPVTNSTSKYYCPPEQYKWPYYPDFCLGGMYTTSVKVVRLLWEISRTEESVAMDDAWITGILRQKLGMPKQFLMKVELPGAVHFVGFSRKHLENSIRKFMWTDWLKIYDKFNRKEVCRCG